MNNGNDPFDKDDQSLNKQQPEQQDDKGGDRDTYRSDNYGYNQSQASSVEDAEFSPIEEQSIESSGSNDSRPQGPTYYSFGNTRPMQAVQPTRHEQATTYNRHTSDNGSFYHSVSQQPSAQPAQPQYRPFTTSSGGGHSLEGGKQKKNSGGFGKMFLSFMAGVVAVGLLMYTADVQNWFTKDAVVSQGVSYNSGTKNAGGGNTSSGTTTSSALMMDRPDNIADLFSTASPAVVKIETYSKASRGSSNPLFNDPFFRQFFGDNIPGMEGQGGSSELRQSGMGTGFFFDPTGYILTNQHVVSDADEIRVIVEGYDEPFVATLLGSSFDLDLAVLKVEHNESFPTLPLGNSESTKIGDWVVAIGNPYGFDHTLTVGVISAKERPIDISDTDGTRNYKNLLQTDASINPGNSGGPLLNMNGEVIGINTAVSSTAQGIGFAIPTSTISEVLDSLKNNEPIPVKPAPFIGADLQDLNESLAQQLGLSSTEGALVRSIYYNTPAYKGDLKQYDVITEVDGKKMKNMNEVVSAIQAREVGEVVEFTVIRSGQTVKLPIEIGDKNQFDLN